MSKARPKRIICSHCGKRRTGRRAFGINGKWLCGTCLQDSELLRAFLDEQFTGLKRVVRRAYEAASRPLV